MTSAAAQEYAEHVAPSLMPVAATLLALAGIRDGEAVVDVGCGAGLLTHPAAAAAGAAGRVYGVEPDADLLAVARTRRLSPVVWVRGVPSALPFRSRSVDKVVSGAVLHRMPDVRPALAEWARVLRPGGRVAVGAWETVEPSPAEDAVLRALSEHGVDPSACERRVALVASGVAYDSSDLPWLLSDAGLCVTHEAAADVTVPFVGAAAYATWRLSFPRAAAALSAAPDRAALRSSVTSRVEDLLGRSTVLVRSGIRYATASPR